MFQAAAGIRPAIRPHLLRRPFASADSTTSLLRRSYVYPKEGVFQPNSPPREQTYPPYAPALNSTQRQPRFPAQHQQPSHDPNHYSPPPLPPPQQYFGHGQPPPGAYAYPPPDPPRSLLHRLIPRWTTIVAALLFTSIGFYTVHSSLDIFTAAEPGTEEDEEDLKLLYEDFEQLLLVKQLREAHRTVDGVRKPVYKEWTAYEAVKEPWRRRSRLTTGPLAGSAGVAAQRLFWDEENGVLFCFINFGPACAGWPNVVHGGAIATIADEALGRVAVRRTEEHTVVTASLEMKYTAKVEPGMWFVWAAAMDSRKVSTERKKYVQGKLVCCSEVAPSLVPESVMLGDVHVHAEAKGLFVVPKAVEVQEIPDDF